MAKASQSSERLEPACPALAGSSSTLDESGAGPHMLRLQAGTLGPGEVSANIETGGSRGVRSQCAADQPLPRWGPRKAPLSPGLGGGPAVSRLAWGGESGAPPGEDQPSQQAAQWERLIRLGMGGQETGVYTDPRGRGSGEEKASLAEGAEAGGSLPQGLWPWSQLPLAPSHVGRVAWWPGTRYPA